MSNDLITQNEFTSQLAEFEKIQDTCRKLLQTKHYAKLGEEGIHVIMARSKALGIHPFEALNGGFFVIHGKVGMSTEMMAALVRKNGHSIKKDPKSNGEICILHGTRADNGDTWTCSFSKQDAIAAGLWDSATWKKYPGVMLYNRCMSMLFRQLFPDLSLGAGYVEDELREITKSDEYAKGSIDIQPIKEEVKQIEQKESIITAQQGIELANLLQQCSSEYQQQFFERMLKNFGSKTLAELPSKYFDVVKAAFIKKMDENHSKQREEYEESTVGGVE